MSAGKDGGSPSTKLPTTPERAKAPGTMRTPDTNNVPDGLSLVLGIAVVDFNHLVGPQVEYSYPSSLTENEDLSGKLPFLALPDGSHLSDEDFCYFHLECKSLSQTTLFGISCNRQITSDSLINKGAQVTRSTVQKAVVVLATQPIFGPIREKLGMVTRAFFAQRDLSNLTLLEEFYDTLKSGLRGYAEAGMPVSGDDELSLYMGTSLREFVYTFRFKTLVLLKLLLLQRKIMFFGYPVEHLCTSQYSLVSLVPGLLPSLQDAAMPDMDHLSTGRQKVESLKMSDRRSLMAFMGLPLPLFGEGSFFQPYCPLQQLDMLSEDSWLIGTTNRIFRQQRKLKPDVFVDLEQTSLDFGDSPWKDVVALTPSDRKWMDDIIQVVSRTWNESDPSQPVQMQYAGSDDYLRSRFEEYIFGFLSTAKRMRQDATMDSSPAAAEHEQCLTASISHFGADFLHAFRKTRVFKVWDGLTDITLSDLIDYKHPCTGKVTTMSDVALRVSAKVYDLHLEENLGPTREAIGAAIQAGSAGLIRAANTWRSDLARFANNSPWTNKVAGGTETFSTPRTSTDTTGPGSPEKAPSSAGDKEKQSEPSEESGKAKEQGEGQSVGAQASAAFGNISLFLSSQQKAWYSAFSRS